MKDENESAFLEYFGDTPKLRFLKLTYININLKTKSQLFFVKIKQALLFE